MMRLKRLQVSTALALTLCFGGIPQAAAQSSGADKAAAETLFDEGKLLLKEGKTAEAIERFETSNRLDSGIGTLLYLGEAYEKAGRLASAWATFRQAASEAKATAQLDRERIARDRASALEPKLPRMMLSITDRVEGLAISRNGTEIRPELWGVAAPIDSGRYHIEARAPGRKSWVGDVVIDNSPGMYKVVIPALESAGVVPSGAGGSPTPKERPPASSAAGPDANETSTQRVFGAILMGVGAVGLGIGTGFAVDAKSKDDSADEVCGDKTCLTDEGVAFSQDALKSGNIATGALLGGAAFLVGGAVVFFTAPKRRSETALQWGANIADGGARIEMGGRW